MEVSTFELLVKPIAPPTGTTIDPVARRVVQGYFLTISNLESRRIRLRVEFFISLPDNPASPDAANRLLDNNAVLLYDVAGNNIPLSLNRDGTTNRYFRTFSLPAGKTASLQLLPNIQNPAIISNAQLEVRGYVSLSRIVSIPTEEKVRVLLNPEIRGTFLPNEFPVGARNLDFDQINYSLAIASGQGLNLLDAVFEPFVLPFPLPINIEAIRNQIQNGEIDLDELREDGSQRSRQLIELLAQVDPNPENLNNFNEVLSRLNIPVLMTRR